MTSVTSLTSFVYYLQHLYPYHRRLDFDSGFIIWIYFIKQSWKSGLLVSGFFYQSRNFFRL